MTDMPEKIAAWRFVPEKADEWIHGGWSEDHDHKTQPYTRSDHVDALLKAEREKALREAAAWAESEGLFRTSREILALISEDKTDG